MFLNDDFLLTTDAAKTLYHDHAAQMPIIDYHCHLQPDEIFANENFENITHAWLGGDHYKWRLMRANGVDEELITGSADPKDKFYAWATTLEKAIGNPLYEWSHLELKRFFGINAVLSGKTAAMIYGEASSLLQEEKFKPRELIFGSNVKAVCTTDDPIDDLKVHGQIAEDEARFAVRPAFRPDKAVNIENAEFTPYISKLGEVAGVAIKTFDDFQSAIVKRIEYFTSKGCNLSDHGVDSFAYVDVSRKTLGDIFAKRLSNAPLEANEINAYKTAIFRLLATNYNERNWVMQLHFNANRNISTRGIKSLGPDTGYDAIGSGCKMSDLALFLNDLDARGSLPKMVVYSLNPNDWLEILTVTGGFQGGVKQRIQFGAAWWFNDTRQGMRRQIVDLANETLLGNFVGMLTDSRSFLSYTRHEYFRRVLCELLGEYVERGQLPADTDFLGQIVRDISYNNAKEYFGL